MSLSKSIFLLLSLLLCFSLFSKQADYIASIYCDVADMVDHCDIGNVTSGTHIEADDQLDANDPFILPVTAPKHSVLAMVFEPSIEDRYLPPPLSRFLRPPLI